MLWVAWYNFTRVRWQWQLRFNLHYTTQTTLHCTLQNTLHYTTQTTLHCTLQNTLHYTTQTTLQYYLQSTIHYTTLNTLHYYLQSTINYATLNKLHLNTHILFIAQTALHYTTPHYTTQTTLHYIAQPKLHYTTQLKYYTSPYYYTTISPLLPLHYKLHYYCTSILALLFRASLKWRLQENRFFLVFNLIIHFMLTTPKAKRCIFINRNPKCPLNPSIFFYKSGRHPLFSALLRSQFGPGCLKQQC